MYGSLHFIICTIQKPKTFSYFVVEIKPKECFICTSLVLFCFFFSVKEQVQADVILTSAVQDGKLLKILQGQGVHLDLFPLNTFIFIN